MKTISGFSYFLTSALMFFGIVTRHVLAEEKCHDTPHCQNRGLNRLFDQAFGLRLTPDDFLMPSMMSPWTLHDYFRPWRHLDLGSTINTDKDKFQVIVDVQHFSPEEISVKTADGYVVIEAKHEEKKDKHGFVSRHFVRRYVLPGGTESEDVISQLSSDGILTVSAPRKVEGKRVVPITQTGPFRREANTSKESSERFFQANDKESCVKV